MPQYTSAENWWAQQGTPTSQQKYIPGTSIPVGIAYGQGPAPDYASMASTQTAPTTPYYGPSSGGTPEGKAAAAAQGLINSAPDVPAVGAGGAPTDTTSGGAPTGGGTVVDSKVGGTDPNTYTGAGVGALDMSSMPPTQSPAMQPLNIRQGLGNRMYPQDTDALAALRKIY